MVSNARVVAMGVASVLSLALAGTATAGAVVVDASANSVSGGVGKDTGAVLAAGEHLKVVVSPDDLWSAGALPRVSNADGLIKALLATSGDDSGYAAGTQIGAAFPTLTVDGYTAPYGSLVGKIGAIYQLLGVSFDGTAWASGGLSLYYWDENAYDNSGVVSATITHSAVTAVDNAVPEPATWAMLILGFGLAGAVLRRRGVPTT